MVCGSLNLASYTLFWSSHRQPWLPLSRLKQLHSRQLWWLGPGYPGLDIPKMNCLSPFANCDLQCVPGMPTFNTHAMANVCSLSEENICFKALLYMLSEQVCIHWGEPTEAAGNCSANSPSASGASTTEPNRTRSSHTKGTTHRCCGYPHRCSNTTASRSQLDVATGRLSIIVTGFHSRISF